MAFGSPPEEGGPQGGAPQERQEPTARPAVSRSKLARAMKRITPQAHDIVVQNVSTEFGYQFIPTEDETKMINEVIAKRLEEQMIAWQTYAIKEADTLMETAGSVAINTAHPMDRNA